MSWKDTNLHKRILRDAEAGGYGVIAAIAYNIEQVLGLVRAAETARSPLIIQFFPWAIEATDGLLIRTAADAARRATVPISIHLDHAQSEDIIKRAADLPFDSIMVDMSHYEKEVNLKKTRELVRYCNERQKATEAEPGPCMTTAEEVDEFVDTGVDVLAPAFGNVHGEYGARGPQLDFERFERIREQANGRVNLALHGTNGFPPELMKRCVAAGVSKINVNKLVLDDYYDHLRSSVYKMPHTQLIEEGIQKVVDLTVKWMEICGSAGRA
ncbi:fructose-bisphosphate aldolase [Aspergillus sclerotioniger CBS 115572]|uniref:Fructose-bisphosphate aldolase n=1 Tax=Aspergillus sclerotioniger CBS 115572 TaxID=1450535 RepID=A0A317V2R1_9EURO|nr:fructose-bisphosphate aldolase [Aspergillus sclerotioniger CBS 115572]PWY66480.1 fructose-bisphosphate aldolase [Aspergillus sclerotioniger CBS 115572]